MGRKRKSIFGVTFALLALAGGTIQAQEYFEKIIPAPSAGWQVREIAHISEANNTYIRLSTWLRTDVNGPNVSAGGYLDYEIADASLGERLYWTSIGSPDPINQIFPQTSDSTLVIQSTDLDGRIHKYEWRNIYFLNHAKGSYEYLEIKDRRIAAANVQKYQGDYYGLYSHKLFRGQWLQEDTIVLAKINFNNKGLDILSQYILPFQPNNAGFFAYRPDAGQFDFVFDQYKFTFDINNPYPISIDSAYYVHYDEYSPGNRAQKLMYGMTVSRFDDLQNLRVVRYDSLGDSAVFKFRQPSFDPGSQSMPTAFRFDKEGNLLVVFNNINATSQKVSSKFLQRIDPKGKVLQQLPLQLKMLEADVYSVYEDGAGNILLSGAMENNTIENIRQEIYLARLSPRGLGVKAELPISGQLALVPNPANLSLTIIGNNPNQAYEYQILNASGQIMAAGTQYLNLNVDISMLPKGAYYFDIISLEGEPHKEAIHFIKY